jgi:uncharacterized protein YcbK (DUF882 family)
VGGAIAGISSAGLSARAARAAPAAATEAAGGVKRISLHNLHTAETLELDFFRGDAYVPDSLAALQVLLRDYRNGEQHAIDPKLMDYLYDVARHSGVDPVFSVISGYRSPQTNALLHERSSGVARHSLHLEGRAIDVRLAGVDCANLAGRALTMSRGGVGYYQRSDFVHLDTGAFRTWKG